MAKPEVPGDSKSSVGSLSDYDSGYEDRGVIVPMLHEEPRMRRVSALSTNWISDQKITQRKSVDLTSEECPVLPSCVPIKSSSTKHGPKNTQKDAWRKFETEAGKIGVMPMMKKQELDTTSSKAFKFLAKFHPKHKAEAARPRKQRSKSADSRPRKSLSMFSAEYSKVISPNTMRKRDQWANTLRSDSILDEEYYTLPYEEINREIVLGRYSKSEPRLASQRKQRKRVSFSKEVDDQSRSSVFDSRFGLTRAAQLTDQWTSDFLNDSSEDTSEMSAPTIISKQNFAELETLLDLVKEQERRLSDDATLTESSADELESSDSCKPVSSRPVPRPRSRLCLEQHSTHQLEHEDVLSSSLPHHQTELQQRVEITDSTTSPSCSTEGASKDGHDNTQMYSRNCKTTDLDILLNQQPIMTQSDNTEQIPGTIHTSDVDCDESSENISFEDLEESPVTNSEDMTEDFHYYDEHTSLGVIDELPDEEYWHSSPQHGRKVYDSFDVQFEASQQSLEVVLEVPEDMVTPEPTRSYSPIHVTVEESCDLLERLHQSPNTDVSPVEISSDYDHVVERQLLYGTKGLQTDDVLDNVDEMPNVKRLDSDSGKSSSSSNNLEYDSAADSGSEPDEMRGNLSRESNFDVSFHSDDSLLSKHHLKDSELGTSLSQIIEYDSAAESGSDREESRFNSQASTPIDDKPLATGKLSPSPKVEYDSAFSTASTPFSEPDLLHDEGLMSHSVVYAKETDFDATEVSHCHTYTDENTVSVTEAQRTTHLNHKEVQSQTPSIAERHKHHTSTLLSSFKKLEDPSRRKRLSSVAPDDVTAHNRMKIKEALSKAGISPTVMDALDQDEKATLPDYRSSLASIFMAKDRTCSDHQIMLNTKCHSTQPRVTVTRMKVPLSQIRNQWLFSPGTPLVQHVPPTESHGVSPTLSSERVSSGWVSATCSPTQLNTKTIRVVPLPTTL